MRGYPKHFGTCLWGSLAAVSASGLWLAPGSLFARLGWDPIWRASGGLRLGGVALHVVTGLALTLLLGALWAVHVRRGWRRRAERVSGTVPMAFLALLAVTGLGCSHLAGEWTAPVNAVAHLLLGLCTLPAVLVHAVRGRRHRRLEETGERDGESSTAAAAWRIASSPSLGER